MFILLGFISCFNNYLLTLVQIFCRFHFPSRPRMVADCLWKPSWIAPLIVHTFRSSSIPLNSHQRWLYKNVWKIPWILIWHLYRILGGHWAFKSLTSYSLDSKKKLGWYRIKIRYITKFVYHNLLTYCSLWIKTSIASFCFKFSLICINIKLNFFQSLF